MGLHPTPAEALHRHRARLGFGSARKPRASSPHLPSQKGASRRRREPAGAHGGEKQTHTHHLRFSSTAHGLDSALDSAAGGRSPPSHSRLREALLWTLAPVPVSLSPPLRCSPVFNRTFLFSLRQELARDWLPACSRCVQEPSDKPATEALQPKCYFSSFFSLFFFKKLPFLKALTRQYRYCLPPCKLCHL